MINIICIALAVCAVLHGIKKNTNISQPLQRNNTHLVSTFCHYIALYSQRTLINKVKRTTQSRKSRESANSFLLFQGFQGFFIVWL